MSRKTWSYLFFAVGFLNALLGMVPANPLRMIDWMLVPVCLFLGVLGRKTMISKPRNVWHYPE